jgi:hypothetical protein
MSISSIHIAVILSMVDDKCSLYELAAEIEAEGRAVEEDEDGKRVPGAVICASWDSTAMSLLLRE